MIHGKQNRTSQCETDTKYMFRFLLYKISLVNVGLIKDVVLIENLTSYNSQLRCDYIKNKQISTRGEAFRFFFFFFWV